jgi:rare lipoprotein A
MWKVFALMMCALSVILGMNAGAMIRPDNPVKKGDPTQGELIIESIDEDIAQEMLRVERACAGCSYEDLQAALLREFEFYYGDSHLHALSRQVARRVIASWYGGSERLNRHTANGDVFNPNGLTAAMRSCPFGTMVKVTNPANGKSVVVRINDRGPAKKTGASIDLSKKAARLIGINKGPVIISKC